MELLHECHFSTISIFLDYARAKVRTKVYLYDMLWAMGTGQQFKEYPRYLDMVKIDNNPTKDMSGADIVKALLERLGGEED